jgi:GNAT superfamily N-acetyltransferase
MAETTICLKQYINQEDYRKIEELRKACTEKEDIFLKVELDFMINISLTHSDEPFENINEFFYYSGDTLAGYLGIYNFGGVAAKITGMVHPLFRGKGIFRILYNLAINECIRRKFGKILLVCDRRSDSGS